jgi:hypothetical protein
MTQPSQEEKEEKDAEELTKKGQTSGARAEGVEDRWLNLQGSGLRASGVQADARHDLMPEQKPKMVKEGQPNDSK